MAIQTRNKRKIDFNTSSMSDLVFLLLIFFMLTSTLISPNAIKLLLPNSSSKTMAKPAQVTVYINSDFNFFIEDKKVNAKNLQPGLEKKLKGQKDASVVLRSDKTVPVQYVVTVIDAVNNINKKYNTKNKVILATKPVK
ncbi:MAG: biopolymer transporter ExbD [Bacteroidales bacterium]|nr:biopolymer transporter ExbD [Bacteroidales bacterium]